MELNFDCWNIKLQYIRIIVLCYIHVQCLMAELQAKRPNIYMTSCEYNVLGGECGSAGASHIVDLAQA